MNKRRLAFVEAAFELNSDFFDCGMTSTPHPSLRLYTECRDLLLTMVESELAPDSELESFSTVSDEEEFAKRTCCTRSEISPDLVQEAKWHSVPCMWP